MDDVFMKFHLFIFFIDINNSFHIKYKNNFWESHTVFYNDYFAKSNFSFHAFLYFAMYWSLIHCV